MNSYLHYTLRLRSPAIVSTLSGDPNSAATQSFIPGSALRGALAARLLASGVDGDSEEFHRLILSGQVCYLHAYPELAGDRSRPVPSSWKRLKTAPDEVHDLAGFSGRDPSQDDADAFDWPDEALSAVPAPFTSASGSSNTLATPQIGSRLHQQRDRIKGRPWKDDAEQRHGAIFAYEYLEADQVFRGVIQIKPDAGAEIERIKSLLGTGPILIGRSRRAGYGGEAEVEFTEKAAKREYENVSTSISQEVAAGKLFRVYLVSAYIGRHPETGQIDPGALQEELHRRLNGAATVERTRWAFETVGAFNRKWRLEIPQALAVAAGSVLVMKATASISTDTLRAIEDEGIGERRVEGFGRVLFLEPSEGNHQLHLQNQAPKPLPVEEKGPTSNDDEQLNFLEQRIVLAAVRAELDRVAALDLATKVQKRPTNSLLGRLRSLFRGVTDEQTAQAALRNLGIWCGDGTGALKDRARDQLKKCRIGDKDSLCWLGQLAKSEHCQAGWDSLVMASGNQATLTGLATRSHLTSPNAAKVVLHKHSALLRVYLIDALLGIMARQNRGGAR